MSQTHTLLADMQLDLAVFFWPSRRSVGPNFPAKNMFVQRVFIWTEIDIKDKAHTPRSTKC